MAATVKVTVRIPRPLPPRLPRPVWTCDLPTTMMLAQDALRAAVSSWGEAA